MATCQSGSQTTEQVKAILTQVLAAFAEPTNAARLQEARESACGDTCKMLQLVLPVAIVIQQQVIQNYGFSNDGEGVLKFTKVVRSHEAHDPEIAAMAAKLKSTFLPPLTLPTHNGTAGNS